MYALKVQTNKNDIKSLEDKMKEKGEDEHDDVLQLLLFNSYTIFCKYSSKVNTKLEKTQFGNAKLVPSSTNTTEPFSSNTPITSHMMPPTSRDDRLRYSPRSERAVADELGSPPPLNFAVSLEQLREIFQTSSSATIQELGPLPSATSTLNDLWRQKEFVASMGR
ncbi:hypothetical protein QE152_g20834 [Popillia japonica]|uniref:Uncharacterized protein n=1 Tax=Popillia japonica TaxID=7064 RepID=A0AAW1KPD2_POPJA